MLIILLPFTNTLDLDLLFCITENALSSSTVTGIHYTKLVLSFFEMMINLLLRFAFTPLPHTFSVLQNTCIGKDVFLMCTVDPVAVWLWEFIPKGALLTLLL